MVKKLLNRLLLFFILTVLISACATVPTQDIDIQTGKNACTIEAIQMHLALKQRGLESHVLSMWWFKENMGHSVTVYFYPPGVNQLFVWDAGTGSTRIRAYVNNPQQIAREWTKIYFPGRMVFDAIFEE